MDYLEIAPHIAEALASGHPVVALESTIIAHGMPWPQNAETALAIEKIIEDAGALPATIAVVDGQFKVGLTEAEITSLAQQGARVQKASLRDLPWLLLKKLPGATTVAATLFIAHRAGIEVFATGGIGGVHRDASETFDVSADLPELSRRNVAVVCAGAKSILDLPLTLEYLETLGVPVVGYRTREFPAFYTSHSGLAVDCTLNTPEEVALFARKKWDAGLTGGVVVANPIPKEDEPDNAHFQGAIEQALVEVEQKALKGKAITPFLLQRISELTGGDSLRANIRLVENNARLAAQIAVALCKT